jgi:hypothetical protein
VTRSMVAWKRSFYSAFLFFEYFLALLSREINCEQKKKKKKKRAVKKATDTSPGNCCAELG